AFSLFITRTPLNVVVYLGIIMLGGIAVNNGIVLIEFVNQLRKEGYSAQEAVLEASKTRLRPILMTSLTTILGLLPLALGIGEGAELQAPLALTVMGGLTSATFLTLVFIPALYLLVAEKIHPKSALEAKIKTQPQETKAKEEAKPVDKITLEEKIKAPEELKPRQELKHFQKIEPPQEVKPAREIKLEIIKPKILPPEFIPIAKQEAPPAQEEPPVQEAPLAQGELNSRQIEILENLKTLKKITRKQYADMFAISIPTAARDLKELLDKKLVNACGPLGPGRWYELEK
ncbi:MAG: efflux RND transporter permease subunit, partial [Candidatus Omnitrophota bacterium]